MVKKLFELKPEAAQGIRFEESPKDMAIIGIALRFPKANNLAQFWENLAGGVDCVGKIPAARAADVEAFMAYRGLRGQKYFEKGYLDDIDKFDCSFFGIPPKEAALMDPSQRLFLETAWEAAEDAGYGGGRLKGSRTGVFLGFGGEMLYRRLIDEVEPESGAVAMPGNLAPVIAGRVAYLMDLKGPNMAVNTTCSSSLVALHYACQSIRGGECGMAIVGSVSLNLLPVDDGQRVGLESSDGKTRAFDDSSDGSGSGEGVAALIIKPLGRALDDGDRVYAVVKGSAVNQSGSSMGLTVPNPEAQEDVIVRAWKNAGVDPETVTYIEAHGTGTKLGDPIEIDGIQRAFKRYTARKAFCAVGTVKSNIGHLDSASGMAGIIKAVLALRQKELPPTLYFRRPNRQIAFEDSAVYVNDRLADWEADAPRRCGVNSFGISGTNCHVILEEAPAAARPAKFSRKTQVLAVSARSEEALAALLGDYRTFLKTAKPEDLPDICYTAAVGRGHYGYRAAFLIGEGENPAEAVKPLCEIVAEDRPDWVFYGRHSVVNDKRRERADGELTAGELARLDAEADIVLGRLLENGGDDALLRELLRLYVRGAAVAWSRLYRPGGHTTVRVPTYPFEKRRCWIEIPRKENPTALPEVKLRGRADGEDYTEKEKKLGGIWGLVLGLSEINVYDNFFELGGHSLLAARLDAELEKRGLYADGADVSVYGSIAEMAAFLDGGPARSAGSGPAGLVPETIPDGPPGGEAQTVAAAGMLDGIEPFNDSYYVSCFYNSFFPVPAHFGRSVKPFLINDVIKYNYQWLDPALAVEYLPFKSFEEVLCDDGLKAEQKFQSDDIIGDVKSAVDGGRPVILWVDCYYESQRADTYLKKHLSHTWLVFGYDDDRQCCLIVEHSRSDNLSYEKRSVSYWDVVNCYHGYLAALQEGSDPSFYSFSAAENATATSDAECAGTYFERAVLRGGEMAKELEGLADFTKKAAQLLADEGYMRAECEKMMNILTAVINAKQVERYRLAALFGERSEIALCMGEIAQLWDSVRKPIARYVYSQLYNRASMEKAAVGFEKIYERECQMCKKYVVDLDREEGRHGGDWPEGDSAGEGDRRAAAGVRH